MAITWKVTREHEAKLLVSVPGECAIEAGIGDLVAALGALTPEQCAQVLPDRWHDQEDLARIADLESMVAQLRAEVALLHERGSDIPKKDGAELQLMSKPELLNLIVCRAIQLDKADVRIAELERENERLRTNRYYEIIGAGSSSTRAVREADCETASAGLWEHARRLYHWRTGEDLDDAGGTWCVHVPVDAVSPEDLERDPAVITFGSRTPDAHPGT